MVTVLINASGERRGSQLKLASSTVIASSTQSTAFNDPQGL
jgi:hypothetical protein